MKLCVSLHSVCLRFRALDINNGGLCVVQVNARGEPMLECVNSTAHLQAQAVAYHL